MIHAALDAGMTLLDTADVYCIDDEDIGYAERLCAVALSQWSGDPETAVVATKGGLRRPGGSWTTDGRPEHLRQACELSLKALGVHCIDLYQLHAPDSDVPFEESVGALARLQERGKIRHIGLSNVSVEEIKAGAAIVEVVSVQNRFNLLEPRSLKDGVLQHCIDNQITFLPHSPVGGHRGHTRVRTDPTLAKIAAKHDATPYQVCLAWLLTLGDVVVPIPGASRAESARSSAGADALQLDQASRAELTAAFAA